MKTRQIELRLKFPIPAWFPYKSEWQALFRTLAYRLSPDHCHVCGKQVDFMGREFRGEVNGRPVMLSQYTLKPICQHCTAVKLQKFYQRASLFVSKCDCCGEQKRVTGGVPDLHSSYLLDESDYLSNKAIAKELDLDVRYGMQWWNGFNICETCVLTALATGHQTSSSLMVFRGTTYAINHRGALIKPPKGKT